MKPSLSLLTPGRYNGHTVRGCSRLTEQKEAVRPPLVSRRVRTALQRAHVTGPCKTR